MSMAPEFGAPDAAPAEDAAPKSESKKNIARAIAALEIASGSPDVQTAAGDAMAEFAISPNSDGGYLVSVGDVDCEVPADMVDAEVPEELAEIDDMPDPEAA